jgi:hypothetical protein
MHHLFDRLALNPQSPEDTHNKWIMQWFEWGNWRQSKTNDIPYSKMVIGGFPPWEQWLYIWLIECTHKLLVCLLCLILPTILKFCRCNSEKLNCFSEQLTLIVKVHNVFLGTRAKVRPHVVEETQNLPETLSWHMVWRNKSFWWGARICSEDYGKMLWDGGMLWEYFTGHVTPIPGLDVEGQYHVFPSEKHSINKIGMLHKWLTIVYQ